MKNSKLYLFQITFFIEGGWRSIYIFFKTRYQLDKELSISTAMNAKKYINDLFISRILNRQFLLCLIRLFRYSCIRLQGETGSPFLWFRTRYELPMLLFFEMKSVHKFGEGLSSRRSRKKFTDIPTWSLQVAKNPTDTPGYKNLADMPRQSVGEMTGPRHLIVLLVLSREQENIRERQTKNEPSQKNIMN